MNADSNMAKQRITVSLSKDVVAWLDKQIENRNYKDRSHAIEKLVYDTMQKKT